METLVISITTLTLAVLAANNILMLLSNRNFDKRITKLEERK